MKKVKLSVVTTLLVAGVALGAVSISNKTEAGAKVQIDDSFKNYGQYIKGLNANSGAAAKGLTSGKEKHLNKNEYLTMVKYYESIVKEPSNKAKESAKTQIIEEAAIIEMAKELNIAPTPESILERVKQERVNFENADTTLEENQQSLLMVEDLIKGLELTEEQYWNEYVPQGYVVIMSEENLFDYVTKDIPDLEEKKKEWQDYKKNIIVEYKKQFKSDITQLDKY